MYHKHRQKHIILVLSVSVLLWCAFFVALAIVTALATTLVIGTSLSPACTIEDDWDPCNKAIVGTDQYYTDLGASEDDLFLNDNFSLDTLEQTGYTTA